MGAVAATVIAALLVGVFLWSRRASQTVPELEKKVVRLDASNPADGPQVFDTKEDPSFKAGLALRPMDRDIFQAVADPNLERTSLPDVFPSRNYRVRMVGSVAEHRIDQVLIDLDRDGKWDEHWQLTTNEVKRAVEKDPLAGGQAVKYTLAHGRWQVH